MTEPAIAIPEGFVPHTRHSPLTEPWAPIFARTTADAVILGLHLRTAHTNSRGMAHGGLVSALADNAMGLSCGLALEPGALQGLVTISLQVDFLASARIGQWFCFETAFVQAGGTLCFANGFARADGEPVARASATFRVLRPRAVA